MTRAFFILYAMEKDVEAKVFLKTIIIVLFIFVKYVKKIIKGLMYIRIEYSVYKSAWGSNNYDNYYLHINIFFLKLCKWQYTFLELVSQVIEEI